MTDNREALAEALMAIWYDTELHKAVPAFQAELDARGLVLVSKDTLTRAIESVYRRLGYFDVTEDSDKWAQFVLDVLRSEAPSEPTDNRHSIAGFRELIEQAEAPSEPTEPCRCRHPHVEHTGRSLRDGKLQPTEARMGRGCEHREDWHHTCACPTYRATEPTGEQHGS